MTIRIERVDLPGIGVRNDLVTESGSRLGVISFRDGERELAIYDADDPDSCRYSVSITEDEAEALADIFGASVAVTRLTKLSDETDGLYTEKIKVGESSPFAGRTLGDTKMRTRTHVSIVALLRERKVIPSPVPDEPLIAGDIIIAVGTRSGLDAAMKLVDHGPE
ncbi:cation:proton antiporter regulatory subunit [Microbacterium sp. KUDC0406]|uniref:cation:proton antiporter regulatory subunit n=1 Tax=Microbacterium sp. KUDC0406 TaxID=2909588 RepID=UPI001F25D886|nr:cation:proton antiporter regulatory subunit [Microbacterium sp. KUDC0406]UJP09262.1 cation:proton antiporter regulatory subunit [Microbacterium sp. KUDC0406]